VYKYKKISKLFLPYIIVVLLACNKCGKNNFNFFNTSSIMNKNITLKVPEVYTIDVDNLGGAGYCWQTELNDSVITKVEILTVSGNDRGSSIGGVIKQQISITALRPGKSSIKIVQKRVWESEPPLNVIYLEVTVP